MTSQSASSAAVMALAESILAGARALDASRFASHFSDRPDLVYLINTRQLGPRDGIRNAFERLLSNHQEFSVHWTARQVQMLAGHVGVFTGQFETTATRKSGERWEARGTVTFVAVEEPDGWRVVNWHTSE